MTATRQVPTAVPITPPMPLCGSSVQLLACHSALQMILWDEGWPEGAAGSNQRPTLTRFVGATTASELRAIADKIDALQGVTV